MLQQWSVCASNAHCHMWFITWKLLLFGGVWWGRGGGRAPMNCWRWSQDWSIRFSYCSNVVTIKGNTQAQRWLHGECCFTLHIAIYYVVFFTYQFWGHHHKDLPVLNTGWNLLITVNLGCPSSSSSCPEDLWGAHCRGDRRPPGISASASAC